VRNQPDPLARALARLTDSFEVPTIQGEDGDPFITVVTHEPLLAQLREAVVGGIGSHEGSSSSDPRARLPFDPGAQAIYDNIARIARTWHTAAALRSAVSLEGALVDWGRHYRRMRDEGEISAEQYARRAARIDAWCDQIEALFDPPTMVPLQSPCPVCKRIRIVNQAGEHVLALVVEYWKVCDRISRTNARCRGADCAASWTGWGGVQTLMGLLDAQDPKHQPGQHEHAHALAEDLAPAAHLSTAQVEQVLTGAIPVLPSPTFDAVNGTNE
jgi:hypothetical protein